MILYQSALFDVHNTWNEITSNILLAQREKSLVKLKKNTLLFFFESAAA